MPRSKLICNSPSLSNSTLSVPLVSKKNSASFRRALLAWYDKNRRDLPWRKTRDPYAIWLSEIMLQQTRVAAVLEHYRIFLQRFPDVEALAAAPLDDVLAAWSGLGYYRRARMLHQCAQEVVERYAARFPHNASSLRELPGIGRYTSAAIASIAFDEPIAVVDGNVERVLERATGKQLTIEQLWMRAQQLVPRSRSGDFNQAMMELGATVCLPRAPLCLTCPVRQWCSTQGELPRAAAKSSQKKREIWCNLIRRDGHLRLVKRASKESLMAGMWELPHWTELPHASASQSRWRTFRHSITVTDYKVHVLRGWKVKGCLPTARGKWVAIDKIATLPITGLTRKILKADGII